MKRTLTVFLATLVSCSHVTPIAEKASSANDLTLSLVAVQPVIPVGAPPRFRFTLTNVSNHSCRILDVERRVDLQHTYYDLVVTKGGKPVDMPRAISDPGIVSDADWLEIPPGGAKTFVLTNFPDQFETLPPGVYEAHVDLWRDPDQSHDTAYKSPMAKFTVTK